MSLVFLVFPAPSPARAAVVLVQEAGTLTTGSGALANGQLIITPTLAFAAADGDQVTRDPVTVDVRNGVLNVRLEPNDTGFPAGTSYRVQYQLAGGADYVEYWVVTGAGPLHVRDVVVPFPPAPLLLINLNQIPVLDSTIGQTVCNIDGVSIGFCDPSSGGGTSFVGYEVPTGLVNSSNTVYTLVAAPNPGISLQLFLNGSLLKAGADFSLTGSTITFINGEVPQTGDLLLAWYNNGGVDGGGGGGGSCSDCIPYTGATGNVDLGANSLAAFSITSNDSTDTGASDLIGSTSHATYSETVDPNTQAQTEIKPALAPTAVGQFRQIASLSGGVAVEVWSATVAQAAALAATPISCAANFSPRGVDVNGNATGCQAVTPPSGTAVRNIEYRFCTRDTIQGTWGNSGAIFHAAVLTGTSDDNPCSYQFPSTGAAYVVLPHFLPPSWSSGSGMNLTFVWMQTNTGAGNVAWDVSTHCVAPGDVIFSNAFSYNAPQTTVVAVLGAANQRVVTTLSSLTQTGCAVTDDLEVKLQNEAPGGGTTYANDVRVVEAILTVTE